MEGSAMIELKFSKEAFLKNVKYRPISEAKKKEYEEKKIPKRIVCDMEFAYAAKLYENDKVFTVVIATNKMMGTYGISMEELDKAADENTRNDRYVVAPIMSFFGFSDDDDDEVTCDQYVVSNKCGNGGAASILVPEVMESVSKKLGGDFFILPSSIHEVIAIPADDDNVDAYYAMVYDINKTEVSADDRLSYMVYRYDSKTGKIGIARRSE